MTLPTNVTPVVGFALKEIDAMGADTKNINIIFHPINLRFGVWGLEFSISLAVPPKNAENRLVLEIVFVSESGLMARRCMNDCGLYLIESEILFFVFPQTRQIPNWHKHNANSCVFNNAEEIYHVNRNVEIWGESYRSRRFDATHFQPSKQSSVDRSEGMSGIHFSILAPPDDTLHSCTHACRRAFSYTRLFGRIERLQKRRRKHSVFFSIQNYLESYFE